MTTGEADIPVIELAQPLPGFPEERRFALVRLDEEGMLMSFRSLERADLQFVVVPPGPFFPDYAPEIGDDVAADLEITRAEDALVLLVVRAGASLADTTANLRAPLVINPTSRRASQVVLDDADLPLAAPLSA